MSSGSSRDGRGDRGGGTHPTAPGGSGGRVPRSRGSTNSGGGGGRPPTQGGSGPPAPGPPGRGGGGAAATGGSSGMIVNFRGVFVPYREMGPTPPPQQGVVQQQQAAAVQAAAAQAAAAQAAAAQAAAIQAAAARPAPPTAHPVPAPSPAGLLPTGPRGVALTAPPQRGNPFFTMNTTAGPSTGTSTYGQLNRDAPPANAVPPHDIDIGMREICAFFPSWFLIPDVAMRAVRNDWGRKDIAKAQLHARGRLTKANMVTTENRVQKQLSEGGKLWQNLRPDQQWNAHDFKTTNGLENELRANDPGNTWQLRSSARYRNDGSSDWGHVLLADVARGVVNWPQGQDRLLVTECINYAAQNPNLRLDTSHWALIIHSQGWAARPRLDANHDKQARQRLQNNVADPLT